MFLYNSIKDYHSFLATNADGCTLAVNHYLAAIEKNKQEIFVGGKEILIVHIKRFFPKLFYKIVRKQSPY